MIEVKEIYPFEENEEWIYHYAEDENGVRYKILQKETGIIYGEAVDVYPCRYTYEPTEELCFEPIEEPVDEGLIEPTPLEEENEEESEVNEDAI